MTPNINAIIIQRCHEQKLPPNPTTPPGNHKTPQYTEKPTLNRQQNTHWQQHNTRGHKASPASTAVTLPSRAEPSHARNAMQQVCTTAASGSSSLEWESRWSWGVTDSTRLGGNGNVWDAGQQLWWLHSDSWVSMNGHGGDCTLSPQRHGNALLPASTL